MNGLLGALSAKLGTPQSSSHGEYSFECPKCSNGKRKLGVNVKKFLFNCFRCHWGGALTELLDYLGVEIDFEEHRIPVRRLEPAVRVDRSIPGYEPIGGPNSPAEIEAINYIGSRSKLTPNDVLWLRLGLSQDPKFYGRLIIPVSLGERDEIVYYLARSIHKFVEPKERGPSRSAGFLPRSSVVYGYFEAREAVSREIVVVEGFWDWCALWKAGFSPIALLGSSLSDEQLGLILSLEPSRITVFMDGDEAGREATVSICEKVRERSRVLLDVVRVKGDPDEYDREELRTHVRHAVPSWKWNMTHRGELDLFT